MLDYEGGANALAASEATLLSNGRPLARDVHDGWTGTENHGRVSTWTLTTYDPSAQYTLRVGSEGGTDSRGALYFAAPDLLFINAARRTVADATPIGDLRCSIRV